jgi:hypothetical protein
VAERFPRLIISTEGAEGCGKTRFALSAPRPHTYLDFDYGLEGVEGADRVDIHHTYDMLAAEWMPEAAAKRHALEVMQKFIADFRTAIAAKMRTLTVDTATAAWSGHRFAGADRRYVELEEEFNSLVRIAYASPHTNVILIHHLRPDWKKDTNGKSYKAGTYSRDGMDGILNKVQLGIRQRYVQPVPAKMAGELCVQAGVPGRFEIDVLKCRDNIGLVGATLPGMDFATLGAMVCPTVDWSK